MDIDSAHRAAEAIGEKGRKCCHHSRKRWSIRERKDQYAMIPAKEVETQIQLVPEMYFVGIFSVYLSEGYSLAESVTFANAAAALAVTRIGAQSAIPYKREIVL